MGQEKLRDLVATRNFYHNRGDFAVAKNPRLNPLLCAKSVIKAAAGNRFWTLTLTEKSKFATTFMPSL
jgi:hypothetical protein